MERLLVAGVKVNIAANLFGSGWQALIGLLFVPFYIKFMGVEAYGLVGIFIMIQTLAVVLDLGLSNAVNREIARHSVLPGKDQAQEIRHLVRSLETIYWGIALLIGLMIVLISPYVAAYWIKAQNLPRETVQQAVFLMGLIMALHWPASLYVNGLYGLQRHVLLNAANVLLATFRGIGAIVILWLISPTIQAFFIWQVLVSGTFTLILARLLWQNLPQAEGKPVFQLRLVRSIGRFAAGVASITVLGVILTQLDKVILSKMLPLETFGYYTLASLIATSLIRIAWPVYTGLYPRFTQLVSLADHAGLKEIYHKSCQLMSVLILPVAVVVSLFAYELVFLWTQDAGVAQKTHILVALLVCGTALNSLLLVPHALQLAFGWTRLQFFKNVLSVAVLVPAIVYLTRLYGALGAAAVWVAVNAGAVFLEPPMMHARLLRGEISKWYAQDVFVPFLVAFLVAGAGKIFMPEGMSKWMLFIYLLVISCATLAATAWATPTTRDWLLYQALRVSKWWRK